jgi:hypothetical protein
MSFRKGKPILLHRGRNRKRRPKTFSSEQAAKVWADEQGIKKYVIENVKGPFSKENKLRVVEKE